MCTVYVPPSPNESSQLSLINYLHNLFSSSHTVIVVGDFNCPDINWDLYISTSEFSHQLCDLVFDLELPQMIDAPTHTKGNGLDLILTNSGDNLSNFNILHYHIHLAATINKPQTSPSTNEILKFL